MIKVGDKHKKGIDPKNSDRECWRSLKKYLGKMVKMEIENVEYKRLKEI